MTVNTISWREGGREREREERNYDWCMHEVHYSGRGESWVVKPIWFGVGSKGGEAHLVWSRESWELKPIWFGVESHVMKPIWFAVRSHGGDAHLVWSGESWGWSPFGLEWGVFVVENGESSWFKEDFMSRMKNVCGVELGVQVDKNRA